MSIGFPTMKSRRARRKKGPRRRRDSKGRFVRKRK